MDVIDRLIGHDISFTRRLIDKAGTLPDDTVDKPVLEGNARLFGSGELTVRIILDAMVGNKERWVASITGKPGPENPCQSIQGMKKRLDIAGPEFQRLVKQVRDKNNWDAGFVDALCDPPESFTYGGMLAHVVNFSVYRRNLAIMAFRELGVDDLGIGDPIEWERNLT
jgi:AraC family transcriptional regulator